MVGRDGVRWHNHWGLAQPFVLKTSISHQMLLVLCAYSPSLIQILMNNMKHEVREVYVHYLNDWILLFQRARYCNVYGNHALCLFLML